jgi:hypothetical protein
VAADSEPGETVQVTFEEEEGGPHEFQAADLEKLEDHTLPGE